MSKKDFTNKKDGSVFRTRDSFLSQDNQIDKQGGLFRRVIKVSNNKDKTGIHVVKMQTEGCIKFKKPYNKSRAKPEVYTVNRHKKSINYKENQFVDFDDPSITEDELKYLNDQIILKNIRRTYAINSNKKKRSKEKKKRLRN